MKNVTIADADANWGRKMSLNLIYELFTLIHVNSSPEYIFFWCWLRSFICTFYFRWNYAKIHRYFNGVTAEKWRGNNFIWKGLMHDVSVMIANRRINKVSKDRFNMHLIMFFLSSTSKRLVITVINTSQLCSVFYYEYQFF